MTVLLRAMPIVAILGAAAALAHPGLGKSRELPATAFPDAAWSSQGFAGRLSEAADVSRRRLVKAPEIASADVSVRSIDDHAPLQVEATIEWAPGAGTVSAGRKAELLADVKSGFDTFAVVEAVMTDRAVGVRR